MRYTPYTVIARSSLAVYLHNYRPSIIDLFNLYRLRFLPRDARRAERGIATLILSVCLSVCLYDVEVPWSYRLVTYIYYEIVHEAQK